MLKPVNHEYNPLRNIVEAKFAEYFSPRFEGIMNKMQEHYRVFASKCKTENDLKILNKIFKKVKMKWFEIYFPHNKVRFTVRELIRMNELWFVFDSENDRQFDVVTRKKTIRAWFFSKPSVDVISEFIWSDTKQKITEKELDGVLVWSFFEKEYPDLFKDYSIARKELDNMFSEEHKEEFASMYNQVANDLQANIASIWVWRFEPSSPSEHKLLNPEMLDISNWSILWNPWINNSVLLNNRDSRVLSLQTRGILPSIFNPSSLDSIAKKTHHFLILYDISNSTGEWWLYKYINVACAQLKYTIERLIKNAHVSFLPYNEDPQERIDNLSWFMMPDGWTYRHKVFDEAVKYLKTRRWVKTILNVWDGLPNFLGRALEQAEKIPLSNISYWQVIFPHNLDKYREDVRDKVLELLWLWWVEQLNWEEAPEYYFRVAQAAKWWQIVVPVPSDIAWWLLWLADLSIWKSFLVGDDDNLSSFDWLFENFLQQIWEE